MICVCDNGKEIKIEYQKFLKSLFSHYNRSSEGLKVLGKMIGVMQGDILLPYIHLEFPSMIYGTTILWKIAISKKN